ncbi:MAG: hypothetical protein ACRDYW_04255, partial [Acidimicrobiales bacterium]
VGLLPAGELGGDEELAIGDTEVIATLGLHRLQSGDVTGAVESLAAVQRRLAPEVDPNLHAALALASAAAGSLDVAIDAADEVDAHPRSTYMDRLTAGIARGLALGQRGDHAASVAVFDQARAAADATEDRISQALVRLADALAAPARGTADAAERASEADRRLAELGLSDTGWRQAFSLALGVSPAA